jgi:hypothetical protein
MNDMVISDAVRLLERDLQSIFGGRLRSLVAYGGATAAGREPDATLAVVEGLTVDDLRAAADRIRSWHEAGLATPLILGAREFARSLDAFPYEFGAILANHAVVSGENPFAGLRVDPADLRRASEVQARSHLLHLREGYVETAGRSDALADLIERSAPSFVALVASVKHVDPAFANPSVAAELERIAGGTSLTSERAREIFPEYLAAVDELVRHIDQWSSHGR